MAATPDYQPVHDDLSYLQVAQSMLNFGSYPYHRLPNGAFELSAYRPPGWPATLWGTWHLFGDTVSSARVVEALIGAVGAVLVTVVAGQVFGRRASLGAGVVAALSPLALAVGASLESETLFITLVMGALAAALAARRSGRWYWLLLVGLLGGLSALTRTNGLLLLPTLGLVIAAAGPTWRARVARFAVPVVVGVLVVAPWTVRNAVELHAFIPVSTEVGNTLAGMYNPTSQHRGARWLLPQKVAHAYPRVYHRYGTGAAGDAALRRAVLRWIGRHPGYPFVVLVRNGARLLGLTGPGWAAWSLHTMTLRTDAGGAVWLGLLAITLLGAAGLWLGRRSRPARWLWLVWAVLFVPAALVNGELRLGAPAAALLSVFAGLALARAATGAREALSRGAAVTT